MEDILKYFKKNKLLLINEQKKLDILHSNGLDSNLGVGSAGLSWNLKAVMYILLLEDHQLSDWFQVRVFMIILESFVTTLNLFFFSTKFTGYPAI